MGTTIIWKVISKLFTDVIFITSTFLSFIFGGFDELLLIAICFFVVEYYAAYITAKSEGKPENKPGIQGIRKKVMFFLLIVIGSLIDEIELFELKNTMVREAVIFVILGYELFSILNHAKKLNIEIPLLDKVAGIFKSKGDSEE